MTRPSAPERPRSSEDRRKHVELAKSRHAERHARIAAEIRPPDPRRQLPPSRWKRLVSQFGWRAYALPLLAVITVLALFTTNTGSVRSAITGSQAGAPGGAAPPTAAASSQLKVDPGANVNNEGIASDALPSGVAYPQQGSGTFHVIAGSSPVFGSGPLHTFVIEAENAMGESSADEAVFAASVMSTLSDPKSWQGHNVSLRRVSDDSKADFRVSLTSSLTVRTLCGYDIQIETSCFAPDKDSRVVLNASRWIRGDNAYFKQLDTYHVYMVNHEVGHALGHAHAHQCLADGAAPVMMQQTIGLKTASGQVCQRNPWPYPPDASDAPGAEQAGTSADQQFVNQNT